MITCYVNQIIIFFLIHLDTYRLRQFYCAQNMCTQKKLTMVCDLLKIFKSSVTAVVPENLIRSSVKYTTTSQQLIIDKEKYDLKDKDVYLIGMGKAVQNMANEMESLMNSKIKAGLISIPMGSLNNKTVNTKIHYHEGATNNLPDLNAETTAKKIEELVTKLDENAFLIVLISGGGSALLPLPKHPITLQEKTALIKSLANSGADIQELNTVRKMVSELKGGQLAIKAQPAQVVSLILSDIIKDPLDLIASGPTTKNTDGPALAINIIKKYNLFNDLPESIKTVLINENNNMQYQFPENNVKNYIIGNNKKSIAAAIQQARNLNYLAFDLSCAVNGNIKDVASNYVKLTSLLCSYMERNLSNEQFKLQLLSCNIPGLNSNVLENIDVESQNLCLILGGEITVEVKGAGKGGRNQQLALEFSNYIHYCKEELQDFDIYFLSAGTDGIDGPTDAAGAIGYLNLVSDAVENRMDVEKYLNENDSYNFYKQFSNGDFHVITGHTNTNVMDIHIIIIRRK